MITLLVTEESELKAERTRSYKTEQDGRCYTNATIGFLSVGGPQKIEAKERLIKE